MIASTSYAPEVQRAPERRPPASDDAERGVLAACLSDERSLISALEVITAEMFYAERHRRIFRAMVDLAERGGKIDGVTLAQRLEDRGELQSCGGREYIGVELITPFRFDPTNVGDYAAIVREKYERRRIIERCQVAAQAASEGDIPVRDIAAALQADMLAVAVDPAKEGFVRVKHDLWNVMESIEAAARGTDAIRAVPTGYHEIDLQCAGGFERGEFVVLAGVPGGCKTAAAMNIAQNVSLTYNIGALFVSAEMTRKKLIQRILSREAHVRFQAIRTGRLTDDDFPRLARASSVLSHAPLWIDQTPLPDIAQIVAKCREKKAEHPEIGLLVVDFIQLVQKRQEDRREKDGNRSAELTDISYKLKGLAKELDVAVIATSQVDASGIEKREDKRPNAGDARWSQGMREAADLFALCFRPKQYAKTPIADTLELSFAKARDSEPFTAVLDWDGAHMTLKSRGPAPIAPHPEFAL